MAHLSIATSPAASSPGTIPTQIKAWTLLLFFRYGIIRRILACRATVTAGRSLLAYEYSRNWNISIFSELTFQPLMPTIHEPMVPNISLGGLRTLLLYFKYGTLHSDRVKRQLNAGNGLFICPDADRLTFWPQLPLLVSLRHEPHPKEV